MKRILGYLLVVAMLITCVSTTWTAALAESPEIVDGRFVTTRQITVEIYDRANDGGSKPEDNFYTDFIKEGMLRDHNVEVTFVPVPRWTEDQVLNNLLAAGDAPDICVTYSYPIIQTYATMGGVLDLAPLLAENKDLIPNLWALLGEANLYWNENPETGTIWAIEAILSSSKRINTFVREDWLNKLNLAAPTTLEEFENMLIAFRDNAELLLGENADKMIPYSTSYDVGWRNDHLFASFVPSDATDEELFIRGFDDRHLLYPGIKEGVRVLNKWYNEGLIWKDFPLYGAGDSTEDNLLKAGYVGAFIHNWDYPYRMGEDSIHANLLRNVGPDAGFIAVDSFQNDEGKYLKFLSNPIDRKVFFPASNDEPVASLLYLDWISKLENRVFLQIGEEGVTHEITPEGVVKTLPIQGEKIMNSLYNIDYTITLNGLDLGDESKTVQAIALGYATVDPRFIEAASACTVRDGRVVRNFNVGTVSAQEGLDTALKEKRDALLNQSVIAAPDQFDSVFDSGMADYLASGGQAIIDERAELLAKYYK